MTSPGWTDCVCTTRCIEANSAGQCAIFCRSISRKKLRYPRRLSFAGAMKFPYIEAVCSMLGESSVNLLNCDVENWTPGLHGPMSKMFGNGGICCDLELRPDELAGLRFILSDSWLAVQRGPG